MNFKDFIKTNYFRFIYMNILSVISGAAVIGAGYVQMYFLTDVKNKDWRGILVTVLLMGLLYIGTQGMIYYIQFEIRIQEEEYNQQIRNKLARHYFLDQRNHKVADVQNRMTNDLEMVRTNFFDWYIIIPFYGAIFVSALIALLSINWMIFLVSIVVDVISYFIPKLIQKKMEQATTNVSKQNKYYLDVLAKWFSGLEELRRYFAGAKLFKIGEQASNKVENAHINSCSARINCFKWFL